jgi:hypothetical protein
MRVVGRQCYRLLRAAPPLVVAAVVAACSSNVLSGRLPDWFTRSNTSPTQAQAKASVGVRELDEECPGVDIRSGAGTLAVAAKAQQPTATDLRYQLSFTALARQCFVENGTVRMRVGVQGRAVVGPAGAPPQVGVPIRYAVVQEGVQPKTIVTKFRRVPLAIPSGAGSAEFTDIEEDLSFPMPMPKELLAYVVYVGFDDIGERPQPKSKKKSRTRK